MTDHRERALSIPGDVFDAMKESRKPGIGGLLIDGGMRASELQRILEGATDDSVHQAALLAYRLGLLVATIHNDEIRRGLDGAREKAKAFHWCELVATARKHRIELPADRHNRSKLRQLCMSKFAISATTFNTAYRKALAQEGQLKQGE